MTMFMAGDLSPVDLLWKSFVKNVPMPKLHLIPNSADSFCRSRHRSIFNPSLKTMDLEAGSIPCHGLEHQITVWSGKGLARSW